MPKNSKATEKKLSNAVDRINLTGLIHLLKKFEVSTYEPTVQKLLGQANDKITNLEEGEQKEALEQIIVFLKNELKHTAATLPVDNNVEAAASSQKTPVAESEENEPDSLSLSSEYDDSSKLESDDPARISSDSPSLDIIDETEVLEIAAAMPSMVTEEKSDNLNDEKDDQQNLTIPTAVDQGTSPIPESQCGTAHNEEDFTVLSQSSS